MNLKKVNYTGGLVVKNMKNMPANAGDIHGLDPWVEKIPWKRAWQPLQYLENPMDREAWWGTVHRVKESDMTE